MAKLTGHKLNGSSLVEVLTATIILMIIMGIGTVVFYKVTSSSYTFQKKKADLLLTKISYDSRSEQRFFDEEVEVENFIIRKEVKKYQQSSDLLWIDLKAYDKENKLLSERKELILVNEY